MFESLADKLGNVFRKLSNKGKLTEKDVDESLREVRLALLEADVNFKVVKDFVARTKERAIGADVLESLSPAHQVVKIVNDELVATLGGGQQKLHHGNTDRGSPGRRQDHDNGEACTSSKEEWAACADGGG